MIKKMSFNMFIRLFTMVNKFLIIFLFAKFFSVEEFGKYNFLSSIVSFSIIFIGMELYLIFQRYILLFSKKRYELVFTQFFIYFCNYIILFIILFIFNLFQNYIMDLLVFFLIIGEHINSEINRILNIFELQLKATILLLIRTVGWGNFIIFFHMYNFYNLLIIWVFFSYITILIGLFFLKKYFFNSKKYFYINFNLLKKVLKKSIYLFISTLIFKFFLTGDKIIMKIFFGDKELGIYAFFMSVVLGAFSLTNSFIFVFFYPKLLKNFYKQDMEEYRKDLYNIFKLLSLFFLFFIPIIFFSFPYILNFLDKIVYFKKMIYLYLSIIIGVLYNFISVFNYNFYVFKQYRILMNINIFSLFNFLVILVILYYFIHKPYIIPFSLIITFFVDLCIKLMFFYFNRKGKK